METAICNLMLPSQRLLSLVHGYWGERAANIGERLNLDVIRLPSSKIGEVFSLEEIKSNRKFKTELIYLMRCDVIMMISLIIFLRCITDLSS